MNKKLFLLPLLLIASVAHAATTYTTYYNLSKPSDGSTDWGSALRDNFDTIDTQLNLNEQSILNHENDTTAAHAASSISAVQGGIVCLIADDVQEFLECLDAELGALTTGQVVTINTNQTITGDKTFTGTTAFNGSLSATLGFSLSGGLTISDFADGILHVGSGTVSSSAIVNADVDSSAAIARTKLANGTASHVLINDGSGVMSSEAQLSASRGGTGLSSIGSANQILGVNSGATALEYKTISGTSNQVTVTPGAGSVTLSLPQNIHTSATPTFGQITSPGVKAADSGGVVIKNSSNATVATFGETSTDFTVSGASTFSAAATFRQPLYLEDPGAGTDAIILQAPTLASSYTLTLPVDDGSANQVLGTNGYGTLSWVDATSGYSSNTSSSLSPSGTISIGTGNGDRLQSWVVQGASSAVTLSTTPFGSSAPQDRTMIILIGSSNTNTVTIQNSDTAKGCILNGNMEIASGDSIQLMYVSSIDRYVEISRNK